ncbi:MAG TPA: hypothetical protein VES73_04135 [Lamprocystis sp. (in: g-proteobacteria)]|nr:hypothetical protein [Lamprocystis sp. (in: g-proteobacteria)]
MQTLKITSWNVEKTHALMTGATNAAEQARRVRIRDTLTAIGPGSVEHKAYERGNAGRRRANAAATIGRCL